MTETHAFDWQRYPAAEAFISERLTEFVAAMPKVQAFSTALLAHTGSRLSDWLDHLVLLDPTFAHELRRFDDGLEVVEPLEGPDLDARAGQSRLNTATDFVDAHHVIKLTIPSGHEYSTVVQSRWPAGSGGSTAPHG